MAWEIDNDKGSVPEGRLYDAVGNQIVRGREIDPVLCALVTALVGYVGLAHGRPLRIQISYDGANPTGAIFMEEN